MEKVSLESFKNKYNEETKTELLDELTGGILGSCHCDECCHHADFDCCID